MVPHHTIAATAEELADPFSNVTELLDRNLFPRATGITRTARTAGHVRVTIAAPSGLEEPLRTNANLVQVRNVEAVAS